MNKQVYDKFRKTESPKADFSSHREILKEAIMKNYDVRYIENKKQPRFKGRALKISGSLAIMAVLAVFTFSTIVPGSLTTQKVLAEAQQSQSSAQEQGRYHYSKTVFTDTSNDEEHSFISEIWEDTEALDYRMRVTDVDGKVINEFVSIGGEIFSSPSEDGSGTSNFSTPVSSSTTESSPAEPNDPSAPMPKIFVDGEEVDPSELDLEGVSNIAMKNNGDGTVELIGVGSFYKALNDVVQSSVTKERVELFDKLLEEEGVELVEEMTWQGKNVVGVSHSQFDGFKSTMYFDADTYQYVGSEGTRSTGLSFVEVITDNTYSDQAIDLSTDGLEELN